jgi:hypothetical protein
MTRRDAAGRLIISCDRCPVQMDLGPEKVARARNRAPSGWFRLEGDRHFCPSCAQNISFVSLARAGTNTRILHAA